jgi:hypothetical protein
MLLSKLIYGGEKGEKRKEEREESRLFCYNSAIAQETREYFFIFSNARVVKGYCLTSTDLILYWNRFHIFSIIRYYQFSTIYFTTIRLDGWTVSKNANHYKICSFIYFCSHGDFLRDFT